MVENEIKTSARVTSSNRIQTLWSVYLYSLQTDRVGTPLVRRRVYSFMYAALQWAPNLGKVLATRKTELETSGFLLLGSLVGKTRKSIYNLIWAHMCVS